MTSQYCKIQKWKNGCYLVYNSMSVHACTSSSFACYSYLTFAFCCHLHVATFALRFSPAHNGHENRCFSGIQCLPAENGLQGFMINISKPLGPECLLCLSVNDFPAPLHQVQLLEESALAEEDAGIASAEAGLQVVDAGLGQVGHYVLFGHIQRGQDVVSLQLNLVCVQIPVCAQTSHIWSCLRLSGTCTVSPPIPPLEMSPPPWIKLLCCCLNNQNDLKINLLLSIFSKPFVPWRLLLVQLLHLGIFSLAAQKHQLLFASLEPVISTCTLGYVRPPNVAHIIKNEQKTLC